MTAMFIGTIFMLFLGFGALALALWVKRVIVQKQIEAKKTVELKEAFHS